MQDLAIHALLDALANTQSVNNYWFADENSLDALPAFAAHKSKLTIITNRFDIYEKAAALGIKALFNDADLGLLAEQPADNLFIRISKEKPITHHLINQAQQYLGEGTLHLAGYKGEGIKSYIKKTATFFAHTPTNQKNKDSHYSTFTGSNLGPQPGSEPLDTQQYNELRTIGHWQELPILSKPGVFGFDKIDEGSAFLIETLEAANIHQAQADKALLDLGCGYGFLSIAASGWPHISLTATDNNAAAIMAITANANVLHKTWEIIEGDAGLSLINKGETFDTILCNPPFHQGFSISGELTQKFVRHTAKLLKKQGQAYFVTNSFIPVEKAASEHFAVIEQLSNNRQFKVTKLAGPKTLDSKTK